MLAIDADNRDQPEQFRDLLDAARGGDRDALGRLLQWYASYLNVLANTQLDHRLRPRLNPSDIVQETLMAAHCDFQSFRGETQAELFCWLRSILIHVLHRCFEHHMKVGKRDIRREISIDDSGQGTDRSGLHVASLLIAQTDTPSTSLKANEREQELARLLDQLSPDHRQVIQLRILRGLPFEEIGAVMQRSPGAVRMLWLRALDAVRTRWEVAHGDN